MDKKGFSNIVLIVVIIVLLGAVGYFAFVNKSKPVVQQSTAGWKTYTNTQYGFELKYPTDWKLGEQGYLHSIVDIQDPRVNPGAASPNFGVGYSYGGFCDKSNSDSGWRSAEGYSAPIRTVCFADYKLGIFMIASYNTGSTLDQILSTFKLTK